MPEKTILLITAAGGTAAALVVFFSGALWPISTCALKGITGLPCVGCGGTRSLRLLLGGNIPGAFLMNPGVTLLIVAWGAVAMYSAMVILGWIRPVRKKTSRVTGLILIFAVAFAALLNWTYLILVSR